MSSGDADALKHATKEDFKLGTTMPQIRKSPIRAVYLNIILPGLGMAYLGRWGYAVLFFLWTPFRALIGYFLILFIPFQNFLGEWHQLARLVILYAWWVVVMYDTCVTPYELALEHNAKIDNASLSDRIENSSGSVLP